METAQQIDESTEVQYTFDELAAALDGPPPPASPDSDDESSQADDAPAESASEPEAPAQPVGEMTVKELAEKLQVPAKDLYTNLKVDLGDGRTVTLGELKDQGKNLAQLQAKATEKKLKAESDLLQKSMALEEATQALGRPLTQQDIDRAEHKRQLHSQAQAALLAEIVPEFADPVERDKGYQLIGATLQDYAFSEAQIPYITDARLRKMAYDLGTLRKQLENVASTEVKKTQKQTPKGFTPKAKSIKTQVRGGRLEIDKAVAELGKFL